jgi:TCP-1/cpn60 chaperonin family
MRAAKALGAIKTENDDQHTGVEIVRKAIHQPARQIVENAGVDGSIVVAKILEGKDYSFGYDAQKGEYGDLFRLGIIDPTKVVRNRATGRRIRRRPSDNDRGDGRREAEDGDPGARYAARRHRLLSRPKLVIGGPESG